MNLPVENIQNLKGSQTRVKSECPFKDLTSLNNLVVSSSTYCEVFTQIQQEMLAMA